VASSIPQFGLNRLPGFSIVTSSRSDVSAQDSEMRVRRKAVIGTVQQYPNLENAWQASNGLRVSINETRNRQREQTMTVANLVDHYSRIELAKDQFDGGKSHATKTVYRDFLTRWVKPIWGSLNIRDVRTIAVENWLRKLPRANGSPLAPSTKAKIRNLMSVLFNHAIRHEWLEQERNSILLVRQSAKRQRIPEWLEPEELSALLSQLDRCFRVMVFLGAATGLRRSELLTLKWGDTEFESQQINVQRWINRNVVGNCKTEASQKPVPMGPILAAELWAWKQRSSYNQCYDCVFASPRTNGKNPYWPDIILSRTGRLRDRELNGTGSRIYRDCNFVVGGGSPLRLTGLCACQGAIYTNLNQPGEQAVSWTVL
jgi:integrase